MNFFTQKLRTLLLAAVLAVGAVCVSNVAAHGTVGAGTFTDKRDGKTYKTVKIGKQTWMAENLNYQTKNGSLCYDNKESNCKKYGRLYETGYTLKNVCPAGWHLPSSQEWKDLVLTAGGFDVAGKKLKSKSGWDGDGNGTDEFGFSAMPGGLNLEDFMGVGTKGSWWTASAGNVYWYFSDGDAAYENYFEEDGGTTSFLSVRCVQNN
jgi:uncharacterized protein (TIGR02145 family)